MIMKAIIESSFFVLCQKIIHGKRTKKNICFLFKISYKRKKSSVSGEKYCGLDIPVAAASDDGNTNTEFQQMQQTQRLLCSYNRERGQQQVGRHGEGGGAELGGRRPLLAARPAPAQAAPLTDRAHRLRGHLHHRQGIHLPTPQKL